MRIRQGETKMETTKTRETYLAGYTQGRTDARYAIDTNGPSPREFDDAIYEVPKSEGYDEGYWTGYQDEQTGSDYYGPYRFAHRADR